MSQNSSNATHHETTPRTEMVLWTSWLVLVLAASLLGDITILVASLKYRAFKLHKMLVVLIQHISVSDMVVSLTCILPQTVSLAAGRRVFGRGPLAYLLAYGPYYGFLSSKLLILALIVLKGLLIKFPLRARTWSGARAHQLCAGVWVFCLLGQFRFLVDHDDIWFDWRIYRYNYRYTAEIWGSWLSVTYFTLTTYLPNTVILLITFLLIKHLLQARKVTRRSGGSLRWQGLLTVVVTASVYSVCYLPYAVYFAVWKSVKPGVRVFRFAATCGYLNTVANFFIYSLTVKSFKTFLRERLRKLLNCKGCSVTKIANGRNEASTEIGLTEKTQDTLL